MLLSLRTQPMYYQTEQGDDVQMTKTDIKRENT